MTLGRHLPLPYNIGVPVGGATVGFRGPPPWNLIGIPVVGATAGFRGPPPWNLIGIPEAVAGTVGYLAPPPWNLLGVLAEEEAATEDHGGPDGRAERRYARGYDEETDQVRPFDVPMPTHPPGYDAPVVPELDDTAAGAVLSQADADAAIKEFKRRGIIVEELDPIALLMLMNEQDD